MIDWTKPIETVDGRRVKVLAVIKADSARAVYVWPAKGAVTGDVFLLDDDGRRCDDSAPIYRAQIVRNVYMRRVRREGWVRVIDNDGMPYSPGDIVFSEKASAEAACQKLGGIPAFIAWEE